MNVLRALNKAEMLDATIIAPMISTWASSSNFWTGNLMDYAKGDLNKDETQKYVFTILNVTQTNC
jgi:hypothetical protein